jgi:hypothetical protein
VWEEYVDSNIFNAKETGIFFLDWCLTRH